MVAGTLHPLFRAVQNDRFVAVEICPEFFGRSKFSLWQKPRIAQGPLQNLQAQRLIALGL